ncbi:MAG TPA: protein YgfX [Gammaproteobacteria bacterium]|nr:protein YgfX [Gammaproteobacteria bacterium]
MSSTPFGEPLDLTVRPSRLIATLLLGMHLTALVVCAGLPVSLDYRAALLLGILSAFFWNVAMYVQRTPRRLHWSPELGWTLVDRKGASHEVKLLPEAYLSAWLIIAHFRDEQGKRRTVMLANDSARSDGLRRLRVLLRYGAPKT